MKRFFFLLIPLVIASCQGVSSNEEAEVSVAEDSTRYGVQKFNFPVLANNVQEIVETWSFFADFEKEAKTLHNLDLTNLRIKTDRVLNQSDSLRVKIPDTLYSDAIISRLTIVNTRLLLLKQEANKKQTNKKQIENYITESNDALANLVVHLNGKFQKDGIDRQKIDNEKKELEKQKRFLDSVFKAELNDQKNK